MLVKIATCLLFNALFVFCDEFGSSVRKDISQQYINEFFETLNCELTSINRESAELAWDSSINTQSKNLGIKAIQLSEAKSRWNSRKCEKLKEFQSHLNTTQQRMAYLLCRGPKFNPYESREVIKELSSLQSIYISTQICVPKTLNICTKSEVIWSHTFVKTPNNDLYQLLFDDDYFFKKPIPTSSINPDNIKCFSGEPDFERLMAGDFSVISEDGVGCKANQDKILYWAWEAWRLAVGPPIKDIYPKAVFLMNLGAKKNGYKDIGQVWQEEEEIEDLETLMKSLLSDIQPFYKMLHAFIKFILQKKYPSMNLKDNFIPAHILGNMWSQNWESLLKEDIVPLLFPNKYDLDEKLKEKNWSPTEMIKRAEDFYTSISLDYMPASFWSKSYIQRTSKNGTNCHGTAANMFNQNDYRMIICADSTFYDFYVIVHEMGHLKYYMSYKDQPAIFQDGTNTAMQESIGDSIFLAMMTPLHINRLNLVGDIFTKEERENYKDFDIYLLMKMALMKIPQIPFEYIFDTFRWSLFSEKVSIDDSNDYFWKLVEKYQGVKAPNNLFNRRDLFDIGSKFHLADNTPYVRYFLASFLQAQIFKGLCENTIFGTLNKKNVLPLELNKCDIYGSKRAGTILKKALKAGSSIHWKKVLYILTGSDEIKPDALLEYYAPLIKWLRQFLEINKIAY